MINNKKILDTFQMLNMSSSTAQMTITQALLFSFIFDKDI
jgi:hypothetical protein